MATPPSPGPLPQGEGESLSTCGHLLINTRPLTEIALAGVCAPSSRVVLRIHPLLPCHTNDSIPAHPVPNASVHTSRARSAATRTRGSTSSHLRHRARCPYTHSAIHGSLRSARAGQGLRRCWRDDRACADRDEMRKSAAAHRGQVPQRTTPIARRSSRRSRSRRDQQRRDFKPNACIALDPYERVEHVRSRRHKGCGRTDR